jgi:DNA-binding transcriptional regulator YdaS (Cro superfamily)
MTLDEYLKSTPVTAASFADRIGVSAASVTRIRKGGQNIPLSLAQKIVSATGGKVTLEDLAVGLAA